MKNKIAFTLIGLLLALGCDYDPGAHNGPAHKLVPDPRAEKMWGSDWCPPCMALHDNVLTQPEFLDYADKNLELVEIDFPRNKPLNVSVELANKSLAEKYKV